MHGWMNHEHGYEASFFFYKDSAVFHGSKVFCVVRLDLHHVICILIINLELKFLLRLYWVVHISYILNSHFSLPEAAANSESGPVVKLVLCFCVGSSELGNENAREQEKIYGIANKFDRILVFVEKNCRSHITLLLYDTDNTFFRDIRILLF